MRTVPRLTAALSALCTALLVASLAGVSAPLQAASATSGEDARARAALHAAQALTHRPAADARNSRLRGRDASLTLRDLALAVPHLHGADRVAAGRLLARPTDLGGDDLGGVIFALSPIGLQTTCQDHVCVHYQLSGANAATADDARRTLTSMNNAWAAEVTRMGYRAPLPDTGSGQAGNPDHRLDVYLGNLRDLGLYGYCAPDGPSSSRQQTAYCALDSDFGGFPRSPDASRSVTAAHEFFHAIQFGYDVAEDAWFMEGSAVWMEDQVHDSINDYVQYVARSPISNPTVPVDQDTADDRLRVYGAFTLFTYVSQRFGAGAVKEIWGDAQGSRFSLQAINAYLAAHRIAAGPFWNTFGLWNALQPGGYQERASYGSSRWTLKRTLSGSAPAWAGRITLDHLASAPMRFAPAAGMRARTLRVVVNAPALSRGGSAMVRQQYTDGRWRTLRVALNSSGDGSINLSGFGAARTRYVAVIPTNASTAMTSCGSGFAWSCGGTARYRGVFSVSARLR